ncbi:hypothetical protein ACFONG_19370 [Uliginosibacterium paludis]|uniref:Uncharacterized protein n=1 Tax=Uliginosibacterium paludis TaxID=1615952 RepID=A0ABV2CUA7_9RHOO
MQIANLADLFRVLDESVQPEHKTDIAALAEQDLYQLHLGVNGVIRSLAYYKNDSATGKQYFQSLGLPDDGSAILGRIYWLHLRGEQITEQKLLHIIERESLFIFDEEARNLAAELSASCAKYKSSVGKAI